jgi:hypothetical protein
MNRLNTTGLDPVVAKKIAPLFEDLLREQGKHVNSIHITGSAVLSDYDPRISDVNSLVLLHTMDLALLEYIAPLGNKYGKHRIAAPFIMTPDYITQSLDSFPIEFLDYKLIHRTVFGEDVLQNLQIDRRDLRVQCEREIKSKLIHLRQGFLSSGGQKKHLAQTLIRSITGSMALFRAIITLNNREAPMPRAEVIKTLAAAAGADAGIFERLLQLKSGVLKPSDQELQKLFESYHQALEKVGTAINDHAV